MHNLNPLNEELSPICHLLALLGAHHIFHVSGLRVKNSSVVQLKKTSNWFARYVIVGQSRHVVLIFLLLVKRVQWTRELVIIPIVKPTRCTSVSNLF